MHAKYWPDGINKERIALREIVKSYLVDIFRDTLDAGLFVAINSVSQDPTSHTVKQLIQMLSDAAGDSADSLKAALIVHTNLFHPRKILSLLDSYYHYLRPNDCPILLGAVAVLANSSYRPQGLRYLER